jgi:DNA/RNA-binding domain of Phe-tRNA-synthetase-like protein
MKRASAILIAVVLLIASPLAAADDSRWLNVHVTEKTEGVNVEVHLPLNLVLAVLNNIDVENFHGGKVDLEIGEMDVNWPEIMAAIKDAPDGEFVKVDSEEAKVRVSKRDGTMYVNVVEQEEANAVVNVTVPMSMIDALSIDENNQIDVAAFLASFDDLPNGELVTVDADDATVRVWVE